MFSGYTVLRQRRYLVDNTQIVKQARSTVQENTPTKVQTDGGVQATQPESTERQADTPTESTVSDSSSRSETPSTSSTGRTYLPGGKPIQQTNSKKAISTMYDTSEEYFGCYVRNTEQIDLLVSYIEYEGERECRRDRIGTVNNRIQQLKEKDESA